MSTAKEEDDRNTNEAQEEALSQTEAPGEVLDPLADPAGSRGTQSAEGSEYDEEDARERPPEDGLNPELPEDEILQISRPEDLVEELEEYRSTESEEE
jgi:hypothetical protein